jgi:serine/threonine protein kinase
MINPLQPEPSRRAIRPREIAERFRLEKILKSSRSGTVFRAADLASGRAVAVKLIIPGFPPGPELDRAFDRFLRLGEGLAGLAHPALPAVLDFGVTPDSSGFLVTEILEGQDLGGPGGSGPRRLLALLVEAVDGLRQLAARGLYHGNLSPENLLLPLAQTSGGIKMLGLGTAALRRPPAEGPGARFRAPEELASEETVEGWRGDLYAVAQIACHLLKISPTFPDAPEPRVALPLELGFLLADAEALRLLLEGGLRRRAMDRPSLERAASALRQASGVPEPVARPPRPPSLEETRPAYLPGEGGESTAVQPAPPSGEQPPEAESALPDVDAMLDVPPEPAPAPLPPASAGVAQPAIAAEAAPAAESTAEAAARPFWRRPLPLAAAAAVLLLALSMLFLGKRVESPVAVPSVQPAASSPPPLDPPAVRLAAARDALGGGDDHRALALLRTLTAADQAALPPSSCELLRTLQETLAASAGERLARDLETGLSTGSLALLRAAVRSSEEEPQSLEGQPAEVLARLDTARQALAIESRAAEAAGRGDRIAALEQLASLDELVPGARDEEGLRERTAAALEGEADTLVCAARYDDAIALLAPLARTWPDRPGLSRRLEAYRQQQRDERKIEELIAAAATAERQKEPDKGLALLRGTTPTPHLEAAFRDAEARLSALLAKLDGEPPELELREGYSLNYDRGQVVNVSFRVRDDYKVESVKVYARAQGGRRMVEVPYERVGFTYAVELTPAFHHNGDVDFYVVATDVSGHQSTLGSPDKPLRVRRTRNFRET